MAADSGNVMKFPCYFLYGEAGGLVTNVVDGRHCLCLFTSPEAVQRFKKATNLYMHGPLEIGIEMGPTWGPESALKRGPPQRTS